MSLEAKLLNGDSNLGFNGNPGPAFDYPIQNSRIHYNYSTVGNPLVGALHPNGFNIMGNFLQSAFLTVPAVLDGNPTTELNPDHGPYNPQQGNGYSDSNLNGANW